MTRQQKRMREQELQTEDVLRKAREIWNRNPDKSRAITTEDREFRTHFGCGVLVFITLWNLLLKTNLRPDGGRIEHLLWTLLFLKEYCKQSVLCSMCGGIDKETLKKWTWSFIDAIASLESLVVRALTAISINDCNDPFSANKQTIFLCTDYLGESIQVGQGQ